MTSRPGPPAPSQEEARLKAAATYNAAADSYDAPGNSFWDRFGRRTVEHLNPAPGARVLDVCSGSGASALAAAERVGPAGRVVAVDLAERLLDLARRKAQARGLSNMEIRVADFLEAGDPAGSFDAVVCVFGIFFVADMAGAVEKLWSLVRPGGRLAVTTWGRDVFEPADSIFWESIRAVRPDLYRSFAPWEHLCEPEGLRRLLASGGVEHAQVVREEGTHPIADPEAWWTLVNGTGYRGTLDRLDAGQRDRVREANLRFVRESGLKAVRTEVLYAFADKRS